MQMTIISHFNMLNARICLDIFLHNDDSMAYLNVVEYFEIDRGIFLKRERVFKIKIFFVILNRISNSLGTQIRLALLVLKYSISTGACMWPRRTHRSVLDTKKRII